MVYNKDDVVAANKNEMGQVVPCEKLDELSLHNTHQKESKSQIKKKEPWTD
jgi:hypothetical protein